MSCVDKGPETATDCTPCSPGIRNRYFRGKLLTVADYDLEQRYMIERRRLINRSMLGWGVVSGFRIEPADGEPLGPGRALRIGPGIALDRYGRELVACDSTELRKRDDVVWLRQVNGALQPCEPPREPVPEAPEAESGRRRIAPEIIEQAREPAAERAAEAEGREAEPERTGEPDSAVYLLAAHYAERQIDGVLLQRGCDDEVCEANRLCETVIYSLTPLRDCPLGLPPCPEPRFGPEPPDWQRWDAPSQSGFEPARPGDRGPHQTLAGWSIERAEDDPPCGKTSLCRIKGDLAFDPAAGVPLACVALGYHCREPYVSLVADSLGPRRLARPNDSLFDLIRGCDLTRIKDVGWRHLLAPHAPVDFAQFEGMFVGGDAGTRPIAPVETQFWVLFSGPVWAASLSPAAIAIMLFHWDSGEAVRFVRRMPVERIAVARRLAADPAGSTRGFRAVVHGGYWLEDIYSPASAFKEEEGTIVEIGVRGGLIVDVHGQLVAAGGGYLPTRPGWPGSDFISAFTVRAPIAASAQSARRSPR